MFTTKICKLQTKNVLQHWAEVKLLLMEPEDLAEIFRASPTRTSNFWAVVADQLAARVRPWAQNKLFLQNLFPSGDYFPSSFESD